MHDRTRPRADSRPFAIPNLKLGVDVLSDTGGVNAAPYMKNLISDLKKHWSSLVAQTNQTSLKQQETLITFTIAPSGQISQMKLEDSTHDTALDQAAWNATKTTSFSPPPAGMSNPDLKLRVHFIIN